jgi:molybdate transport system ATP-binding protein
MPPLPPLPAAPPKSFETAVKLDGVTVTYGGNTLLNSVNWTVRNGEKWAVTGPNGSGKSMLLSLIFADNPQAYSNAVTLFDRRRGTGESIWDVKERIGFVSSEMHAYWPGGACGETALSGLRENPSVKAPVTRETVALMKGLFDYFCITAIECEPFRRASAGQQRLILLIRALLKNPPMLVLDEPFQGMDSHAVELAKNLLNTYCSDRTLIFVSHYPAEIPSCVNRYLNIDKGTVLQESLQ